MLWFQITCGLIIKQYILNLYLFQWPLTFSFWINYPFSSIWINHISWYVKCICNKPITWRKSKIINKRIIHTMAVIPTFYFTLIKRPVTRVLTTRSRRRIIKSTLRILVDRSSKSWSYHQLSP